MHSMGRLTRWGFRVTTAGVGALAVTLAFEFGDPAWFEELTRWLHSAPRQIASRTPSKPHPPLPPITVTPPRPLGNDSSVSPVPLPLILVRTELGRNNREGFAQIGVNAQSPQTYAAGAMLANGARLTEIYEHYVMLERDGHSVRLYLQGEATKQRGTQEPTAAALLTVGGTSPEAAVQIKSEEHLTDYLRPSPVFVAGQLHGYALFAGRKAQAFAQLGLQPGDVLTQVNGAAVSESSDSLASLESLTAGEALTVVIEREGIAQTISLDGAALKDLAAAAGNAPENSASRSTTTLQL